MTEHKTSTADFLEILKNKPMIAAPLAGVTNPSFRQIVRLFFDGVIYTEMISVEGLRRKGSGTMVFLETNEQDMPLGVQLFGSVPEAYTESVKVVLDKLTPTVIDINMGCPVKKVLKSYSGCAMMKDEVNAGRVIRAAKAAAGNVPLTVKMRLGWDSTSINYNKMIKIAAEEGADAVTLHGRTKAEMFGGTVHYDMIQDAKANSPIPVIGNGDVIDMETYQRMLETGVDGVMIGRGMMKQPWIFEALNKGVSPDGFIRPERMKELIYQIMELQKVHMRGNRYLDVSKKYIVWMMKGLPGAASLRNGVYECRTRQQLDDMLDDFFSRLSDTLSDQSSVSL